MIFQSLIIRNIRSYERAKIEFPLGISLFEGDIGSGKSTILMAIEFALFGLGNQRGDSLLRKNTLKGSVILEFEIEGKNGRIERRLLRKDTDSPVKQDTGILVFDGAKWQLSPSEMKEKILKILDFKEDPNPRANSYIFRYAIYTPQEEMKQIISQKPESRLQTLRKAFGIEDYMVAADNAYVISRYLKDKTSYLSGQTDDLKEKTTEFEELLAKKEEKEVFLRELSKNQEITEIRVKEQREGILQLNDLISQTKEIKAEIPHLLHQIKDKQQSLIRFDQEIKKAQDENESRFLPIINELSKKPRPTNKNQDDLNKQIKIVKEMLKNREGLTANLNLLCGDKQQIENGLGENKNKNLDELQYGKEILISRINKQNDLINVDLGNIKLISENKYRLEAKKDNICEKMGNLEELEGSCPICGTLLDSEHKKDLKNEMEDEINKINNELKCLNESLLKADDESKSKERELTRLKNKLEDLESLIKKLSTLYALNDRINSVKINLHKLNEKLSLTDDSVDFENIDEYMYRLEKTLDELKEFERSRKILDNANYQFKKNLERIEENEQMILVFKSDIQRYENDLVTAKEKSDNLDELLQKMDELNSNYDKIKEEFRNLNDKLASTKTLIKSIEESIFKLGEEIQRKEELKTQLNRLNEYQLWLNDYFIPTIRLIENHVMNKRFIEFNDNFQKWFNMLIDDDTKTAKLNDKDFSPIVQQDRFEQDMNYLSGGEKTSVALAYRLALNNVVKKVSTGMKSNLLILDEPTDGFSKEQLYKVREILNELHCPQIILVSHERELESFANTVFRVEKIDGISIVNQISN
ncbi:MAG: AAA family ATPase [Methanobacterium formicicum]